MIIFDLDGTLADCEHRRHFVSITHALKKGYLPAVETYGYLCTDTNRGNIYHPETKKKWTPDWTAFYEACDKDVLIEPMADLYGRLWRENDYIRDIEIWTGRCESVRSKTERWLDHHYIKYDKLKMRPIGDNTPAHELKEKWLNEYIESMYPNLPAPSKENEGQIFHRKDPIAFIFEDDPKCIEMWKRRGIFVFDCKQNMEVQ